MSMALGLLMTALGCHRSHHVHVAPQVGELDWHTMAGVSVHVQADSFRLMGTQSSVGRFPATLAVARCSSSPDGDRSLVISPPNHLEVRRLNQALDHLLPVKGIVPIDEWDLGEAPVERENIIESARTLGADLCLIYGPSTSSGSPEVLRGVILDADSGTALAAIEAAGFEDSHVSDEHSGKLGYRRLGPQPFEKCLAKCVRAMIDNDQPQPQQTPSGWTPEGPIEPAIWPPYQRELRLPGS
jgi:hypothetical protein